MLSLSEDVLTYLEQIIGDLDEYITVLIESAVKEQK